MCWQGHLIKKKEFLMETLKTVSTVLAVLIMTALPLSGCSSEPQAPPKAAAESKTITQEELDALRDAARKGTITQKEREILGDAEEKIAIAESARIISEATKGYFDDDKSPKEDKKNQGKP
jgi:PBP1b-binding outer membrane lipoprotein LpoB